MQTGVVYFNQILAGTLRKESPVEYLFEYDAAYFSNAKLPPISLTLPKTKRIHQSNTLFSFFSGLLAEGINKEIQSRLLKIDENDDFTRLLKTAGTDTIGAITIQEIEK